MKYYFTIFENHELNKNNKCLSLYLILIIKKYIYLIPTINALIVLFSHLVFSKCLQFK